MIKKHTNYYVLPSVIKVMEITKVRIIPRAEQARFDNRFVDRDWGEVAPKQRFPEEWFTPDSDAKCRVKIVPFQNCYQPQDDGRYEERIIPVDKDGGLTIELSSEFEQEILIKVFSPINDRLKYEFSVYAVNEDLFSKRAYKGDLHSHTIYSDGEETIDEVAANYRAAAFDFLSLTDHFKRFPSLMMKEITDKCQFGLYVYPGEEVHVPDIRFHYVHVGGDYSVNEYYVDNKETYQREYKEIYESIDLPEGDLRDFAARLTWIHNNNKKAGGLSIFAHPTWRWMAQNMPDPVTDYVFENGLMDVFELMGGQTAGENSIQLAIWTDWAIKGKRYPIVCSSDQHTAYKDRSCLFNGYYSIVFAIDASFESISKAILNNDNVAVENRAIWDREGFRAYGSRRYVQYAQFLWREFYPMYEYLCAPIGQLMKMYFEGDEKALEMAQYEQKRADNFAEAFFGRKNN